MKKSLLIICLTGFLYKGFGQQVPLDVMTQNRFNEITLSADTAVFTGFRSMNWIELKPYLSNAHTDMLDSAFGISKAQDNYFLKHITNNNWIQFGGKKNVIAIDPYVSLAGGMQSNDSGGLVNAVAGLRLQGVYDDKLSYSIGFISGYNKFPSHVNDFIKANQDYLPGLGKGNLKSNNGYSNTQVTGNLTYRPIKYFSVTAGYGKNFIGDGYRSLILSDNAANYPYLRLSATFWKINYNVLYTKFDVPRVETYGSSQKKYSAMHYLGVSIGKKWQVGLFDEVIWFAKDSIVGERGFDVQYLNPLIFMRPTEFQVGSPDNALLGFTLKYKVYKNGYLYSQVNLDDLHIGDSHANHAQHFGNKYAIQLGLYNKDVFHVSNLSWRLEWNTVRPYTYGHGFDKIGLNYTHDNQTLADPFNANFNEFISIVQYHNKRWYGILETLYTIRGENPGLPYNNGEDLWGGETGVPVYGSKTMQGTRHKYFYNQLTAGYLINPRNGLALQGDVAYRSHTAPGISQSNLYFTIGIQTRLFNFYHDF